MKLRSTFFVLFLSCMFLGCVREDVVEIKPQPDKEKLVVFSFLTPGNAIYVRVGKTQTFGSGNYDANDFHVSDAVVIISNEDSKKEQLPTCERG